jgi:broad specificity phosphatase PhoE
MAKEVELRRHTDNDGDVLTPDGVAAAVGIGRRLEGGYNLVASSGAQRATQTVACLLAGLAEPVPGGVIVEDGLRSTREVEWRAAYRMAGKGDLASLHAADPGLVTEDSEVLGDGLRRLFDLLDDGERALAIGHSPTSEAAVFALTGVMVEPLGKGEGVVVVLGDGGFTVTRSP